MLFWEIDTIDHVGLEAAVFYVSGGFIFFNFWDDNIDYLLFRGELTKVSHYVWQKSLKI